jgi:CPA2 family monovalent cation:H+ antiporter-2
MLDIARRLNPTIETVVRTHSDGEAELMRKEKVSRVFMGEHELARGMIRHVLEVAGTDAEIDAADRRAPAHAETVAT